MQQSKPKGSLELEEKSSGLRWGLVLGGTGGGWPSMVDVLMMLASAKVGGDVGGGVLCEIHHPFLQLSLSQSAQRPWQRWATISGSVDVVIDHC